MDFPAPQEPAQIERVFLFILTFVLSFGKTHVSLLRSTVGNYFVAVLSPIVALFGIFVVIQAGFLVKLSKFRIEG